MVRRRPAEVARASATTTLRVGSLVYSNNFRHPALLAREAATVDVLTDGRLEFDIGAGYYLPEYSQTEIELPPARARVDSLQALTVIKLLLSGPVTFGGEHYTISDMEGWPKPSKSMHGPTAASPIP